MFKFWFWIATSDPDYLQKSCSGFLSHAQCIRVTSSRVCVFWPLLMFFISGCMQCNYYLQYVGFCVHIFIFSWKLVLIVAAVVLSVCVYVLHFLYVGLLPV